MPSYSIRDCHLWLSYLSDSRGFPSVHLQYDARQSGIDRAPKVSTKLQICKLTSVKSRHAFDIQLVVKFDKSEVISKKKVFWFLKRCLQAFSFWSNLKRAGCSFRQISVILAKYTRYFQNKGHCEIQVSIMRAYFIYHCIQYENER